MVSLSINKAIDQAFSTLLKIVTVPTILIVEDEPEAVVFMSKGFENAGYQVLAVDGAQALSFIFSIKFDLILLDLMLYELDGVSLLNVIRAQGIQTPVITMTALGNAYEREQVLCLADEYIAKPFPFNHLLACISAYV